MSHTAGPGTPPRDAGSGSIPLHRKLGIRPGHRVLVIGPPADLPVPLLALDGAPPVATRRGPSPGADPDHPHPEHPHPEHPHGGDHGEPADVVLMFCPDVASLTAGLPAAMSDTAEQGRCWVGWPKRASGVPTDLTEHLVRATGLATGWVDVKVCAISPIWSGLCFMRRSRPGADALTASTGRPVDGGPVTGEEQR
jgi:hypothetical protein